MKFCVIDQAKTEFPAHRLCKVLGVSQNGYFACKDCCCVVEKRVASSDPFKAGTTGSALDGRGHFALMPAMG
ncbi:hypothetical protein M2360_003582 [Rhizobium sp. SG_E_25_P2]|nr:hypothetical protein [Rhizobium sp. SG_E_25_P2]